MKHYDIILIDNRASIDSLSIAVCLCSDIVISVSEDDDLCAQANSNMIDHLRNRERIENIYTIINKGRRITNYQELKEQSMRRPDFNYIGIIPFDIEIMQDFGKERFWFTVNETLYFRAFIDAWNNLAKIERLKGIALEKYRFPPRIFMSKREGRFTTVERMMRIYGLVIVLAGIFTFIYNEILRGELSVFQTLSLMMILVGLIVLFAGSISTRQLLLGKKDNVDNG
jgi:hypothetical protein